MKITVNKNLFFKEVLKVSKIVNHKSTLASLQGILIEVDSEKITIIGSDSSISIKTIIKSSEEIKINKVGSFLIKSRFFLETIRKIDEEFINIEKISESLIKITCKNFNSNLSIINHEEFPKINFKDNGEKIILNNKNLKSLIEKTSFSISVKDKRVVLNGLNLKILNNKIIATASDSYRLSNKEILQNNEYIDKEINIVIPGFFIEEIKKNYLFDDNSENLIFVNENNIVFKFKNTILQSKLIEGTFPDTSNIVPEEFLTKVKFKKYDLIKSIERATAISNDINSSIINLNIEDDIIKINSKTFEVGNSEEIIDNFALSGLNQKIAFNARYMVEALKSFDDNEVVLKVIDSNSPIIINSEKDNSVFQLILPVKVY